MSCALNDDRFSCLTTLASRYVWWKSPEEALAFPLKTLAHIMNLATYEDLLTLGDLASLSEINRNSLIEHIQQLETLPIVQKQNKSLR